MIYYTEWAVKKRGAVPAFEKGVVMQNLRARLQDAAQARLPMIFTVYILLQPLLDVLTGLGAQAGHPVTAGVVVRALVVALAFLYAVFVSDFPGKKRWMIFTGALTAYLVLFMAYMFSLGGLSLCLSNVKEVVKTLEAKPDPVRYRSQLTLARRRIAAFTLAAELVEERLTGEESSR